jgi:hypothetical protein
MYRYFYKVMLAHPADVNESYIQHLLAADGFCGSLVFGCRRLLSARVDPLSVYSYGISRLGQPISGCLSKARGCHRRHRLAPVSKVGFLGLVWVGTGDPCRDSHCLYQPWFNPPAIHSNLGHLFR